MFATPYRPVRLPGTRHPGLPLLPRQRDAGDQVAPDTVTLTGPAPAGPAPDTPQPPETPHAPHTRERGPGRGRDPARPGQRLQNATWSYTGSGTVSPVVSSICVSSVTT